MTSNTTSLWKPTRMTRRCYTTLPNHNVANQNHFNGDAVRRTVKPRAHGLLHASRGVAAQCVPLSAATWPPSCGSHPAANQQSDCDPMLHQTNTAAATVASWQRMCWCHNSRPRAYASVHERLEYARIHEARCKEWLVRKYAKRMSPLGCMTSCCRTMRRRREAMGPT